MRPRRADHGRRLRAARAPGHRPGPRPAPRRGIGTRGLPRPGGRPAGARRGRPRRGSAALHDLLRGGHPGGGLRLPRGGHAPDARWRVRPAQPARRGNVAGRVAQRPCADRRQQVHLAHRHRETCSRASSSARRPRAGGHPPSSPTRSSCSRAAPCATSSSPPASSWAPHSEDDARSVADLYHGLPGEVLLTSRRTAEMIKYVSNVFLATRISFINEIAQLCEAMGVDVEDVVAGVAQDPRIGSHFFRPGIGYGGSCLPKDTASLRFMGETFGVPTPVPGGGPAGQRERPDAHGAPTARGTGHAGGRRIAVWGLTFKGDTEDTRQSPAVEVVQLLVERGCGRHGLRPLASRTSGCCPRSFDLPGCVAPSKLSRMRMPWPSSPTGGSSPRYRSTRSRHGCGAGGPRWSQRP